MDGYNAPLTAGNFVDLVAGGFYDGAPLAKSETAVLVGDSDGGALPAIPGSGLVTTRQLRLRIGHNKATPAPIGHNKGLKPQYYSVYPSR